MDWLELVEVLGVLLLTLSSIRAWMLERGNDTRLAALEAIEANRDDTEHTRRIDELHRDVAACRVAQAVVETKLDAYEAGDENKPESPKE